MVTSAEPEAPNSRELLIPASSYVASCPRFAPAGILSDSERDHLHAHPLINHRTRVKLPLRLALTVRRVFQAGLLRIDVAGLMTSEWAARRRKELLA
jgi:hypothetical protein